MTTLPDESTSTPESLKPAIVVEETPVIEPLIQEAPGQPPTPPPDPLPETASEERTTTPGAFASAGTQQTDTSKKKGCGTWVGNIVFFIILFGLGVWLSTQARTMFTSTPSSDGQLVSPSVTPAVFDGKNAVATSSAKSVDAWISYPLTSDAAEKGVTSVAYQLPASVLAPVCDGSNCASRGTNLPGGTRFTVAARGTGYLLPDFRGAILTDAVGKEFTMKQTTVGGKAVYEYIGDFTGRTGGGYTFTKMRGVLVPITDTTSVELNHFSPTGITSDFATDDSLFDQIVTRLIIPATK